MLQIFAPGKVDALVRRQELTTDIQNIAILNLTAQGEVKDNLSFNLRSLTASSSARSD
jgi:hypothetical protein